MLLRRPKPPTSGPHIFVGLAHLVRHAWPHQFTSCSFTPCSFSCVCTLLSIPTSPNYRACRQDCDARKIGVSSTPNANVHHHNLSSPPNQSHLAAFTPQSSISLLSKCQKYLSKRTSWTFGDIFTYFPEPPRWTPFLIHIACLAMLRYSHPPQSSLFTRFSHFLPASICPDRSQGSPHPFSPPPPPVI